MPWTRLQWKEKGGLQLCDRESCGHDERNGNAGDHGTGKAMTNRHPIGQSSQTKQQLFASCSGAPSPTQKQWRHRKDAQWHSPVARPVAHPVECLEAQWQAYEIQGHRMPARTSGLQQTSKFRC
eukprot:364344-Chlamydomonas_euryale.AAC.17